MSRQIDVLVDLQFGSTGKGLLAGYLANLKKPDTVVTAWMPNAGHTYVDSNGNKMIHTALANGCVSPKLKQVLIAPGSVVDVPKLVEECTNAYKLGYLRNFDGTPVQILIHENATILQNSHAEFERNNITSIGSTQKGSGAAIIAKLKRDPKEVVTASRSFPHGLVSEPPHKGWIIRVIGGSDYEEILYNSEYVLVEGAQGYSLGVNSGFYPFTTSRECTMAQVCSDTLIAPTDVRNVFGCARTFPIRVANRFEDDKMVGWSGPGYSDQKELSWEEVGQEVETTTVTKLPRRIFTFSEEQIARAIRVNGGPSVKVFLNFANYMCDKKKWIDSEKFKNDPERQSLEKVVSTIQQYANIDFLGFGPNHRDVHMVYGNGSREV